MGRTSRVGQTGGGLQTRTRGRLRGTISAVNENNENVNISEGDLRNAIMGRIGYLERNGENFNFRVSLFRPELRYRVTTEQLRSVLERMREEGLLTNQSTEDYRATGRMRDAARREYRQNPDLYSQASILRNNADARKAAEAARERIRQGEERVRNLMRGEGRRPEDFERAFGSAGRAIAVASYMNGGRITVDDLRNAWSGPGVTSSPVFSTTSTPGVYKMSTRINTNGKISNANRRFTVSPNGNLHVKHSSWSAETQSDQGAGAAGKIARNQFGLYKKMGVKSIKVYANGSRPPVGQYVWAKQGFQFEHAGTGARFKTRFLSYLRGRNVTENKIAQISQRLGRDPQPSDIANVRIGGHRISNPNPAPARGSGERRKKNPYARGAVGKHFLINHAESWDGIMYHSNTNSHGRKQNDDYIRKIGKGGKPRGAIWV